MSWVGWRRPKARAASSDAETAIKLLNEVVTWSMLVWFGRQRGMKNWVFATVLFFFEEPWAVYSVLGAVGPRAAATPVALPLEIDGSRL